MRHECFFGGTGDKGSKNWSPRHDIFFLRASFPHHWIGLEGKIEAKSRTTFALPPD